MGCLILREGSLFLEDPVRGSEHVIAPTVDRRDQPDHVGFAHVQLPDDQTDFLYLGFSEPDFLATLADGDRLSLVYRLSIV